jgi:hypothetical protein
MTAASPRPALAAALLAAGLLSLLPLPSHAFLGALAKIGSAVGKGAGAAGAAGKGAAGAVGAVGVMEATQGANAAAKAAKVVGAGDSVAAAGAAERAAMAGAGEQRMAAGVATADDISRSTGLGKAVPDDIAAMLSTPGKTLGDVPDAGTRSWLSMPKKQVTVADADLMVRDYVRLLEGQPAAGPPARRARLSIEQEKALAERPVPPHRPTRDVPWHAVELLVRATHAGHAGARNELNRLCQDKPPAQAAATCAKLRAA